MTTKTVPSGQTVGSGTVADATTVSGAGLLVVGSEGTASGGVVYLRFDQSMRRGCTTTGAPAFSGAEQTVQGVVFNTVVDGLDGSLYVYSGG